MKSDEEATMKKRRNDRPRTAQEETSGININTVRHRRPAVPKRRMLCYSSRCQDFKPPYHLFYFKSLTNIYLFHVQKPNTFTLPPTQQIFFCFLNYLTGTLANSNDFKNTMSITFQKYNPRCGRLKAYW